jgi:hypothetical protein
MKTGEANTELLFRLAPPDQGSGYSLAQLRRKSSAADPILIDGSDAQADAVPASRSHCAPRYRW